MQETNYIFNKNLDELNIAIIDLQSININFAIKFLELNSEDKTEFYTIANKERSQQWLGVRIAAKTALLSTGKSYYGICKNSIGKPFLLKTDFFVSLSHCKNLAVAAIDKNPIAIDIEKIDERLLSIKKKFLKTNELKYQNLDEKKLTTLWCAKESIYKLLSHRMHISVKNITIQDFFDNDPLKCNILGYEIKIHVTIIKNKFILAAASYKR